ncbi:MAG: type IV pilin protein [Nevskiales bacterium]|nr:type IV pilin protein [Nevskiales bacterium]
MPCTRVTRSSGTRRAVSGFTLIELMVTLVIAAILAMVALPAYQSTLRKSVRQVASRTLIELAAQQETVKAGPTRGYAKNFDDLVGISGTTVYVNRSGQYSATLGSDSIYKLTLDDIVSNAAGRVTAYSLTAAAVGNQAKDSACKSLKLTSTGVKTATGTASDLMRECWSG